MAFGTDMLEIIESYKHGGYKEADITFKRVCEEMNLTLAEVIMFRSKIASAIGVLESQITDADAANLKELQNGN